MKRFLSILLALTMLLSMVTISHAADTVTVTYWNADSTKITIDLSAEVDAAVLKAATTLTQNGTPVEFTVTKKALTVNTTLEEAYTSGVQNYTPMIPTTSTTYEINPANGLNFTDIFAITIDSSVTGTTAWSKTFRVNKLWIENFDNYTIANGALKGTGTDVNLPWLYRAGYQETALDGSKLGLEDDGNGNKAMFIDNGGSGATFTVIPTYAESVSGTAFPNPTVNFADTGVAAATYWASGSAARARSEYNIELDLRYYSNASDSHYPKGFKIAMQNLTHQQNLYGGSGIIAGFQVKQQDSYQVLAATWGHGSDSSSSGSFQVNNDNNSKGNAFWTNTMIYGAPYLKSNADEGISLTWNNSPLKKSDLSDGDWSNDTVHKVSMSVLNNNLKYSLDDVFVNYDFTAHAKAARNKLGIFAFNGTLSAQRHIYYIDNIVVTKAEEVTVGTLTASDFSASKANIKFNLNKDIPAETLKSALTLKKDGATVSNFTLEQVADTQYTYAIVPAGGVALGATYTVDIAAGYYTDAQGGVNDLAAIVSQGVKIVPVSVSEPTYINANSTKITIDLPEDVDADALADAIVLKHVTSGESVDFTVEKRVKTVNTNTTTTPTDTAKYVVTPMIITTETTYDIIPVGGVNLDEAYYLEILTSGGIWSKAFKVEKLWIEDFDDYTITDADTCAAEFPWKLAKGSTTSAVFGLKDIGDGNKVMYLLHQSGTDYAVMPAYLEADANSSVNFADTGVAASTYWAKNSEAIKRTEYNVELDLRFATPFSDAIYGHGFNVLMRYPYAANDQTLYGNNGIIAGVNGGKKNGSNYTHMMLAATYGYGDYTYASVASAQVNGLTATSPNYWYQDFYGAPYVDSATKSDVTWSTSLFTKSNLTDDNWTNDTIHKVAMSVKDNNLKFSFDKGFENYDFTPFNENSEAVNHNGLITFVGDGNGSQPQRYVIDNIVVTQFVELTEGVTYGDLFVENAANGELITDGFDGVEKINARINVLNAGNLAKECRVVLAIYNKESKKMVNVATNGVGSVTSGITTFTFDNIEVAKNDLQGDYMEVFFWDSFSSLMPYRAPYTFPVPAAE